MESELAIREARLTDDLESGLETSRGGKGDSRGKKSGRAQRLQTPRKQRDSNIWGGLSLKGEGIGRREEKRRIKLLEIEEIRGAWSSCQKKSQEGSREEHVENHVPLVLLASDTERKRQRTAGLKGIDRVSSKTEQLINSASPQEGRKLHGVN